MLYKLLSAGEKEEFSHAVISLSNRGSIGVEIEGLGVPVIPIDMKHGQPTLSGILRLVNTTRKLNPNILQGWMYHGNIAAQFAAFFMFGKVAVLWNIRQSLYSLSYEKRLTSIIIRLGSILSRFPEYIIYNSAKSALQHEAIGYRGSSRIMIPNGFDTDCYIPSNEARLSVRNELGLAEDTFLIGLVARYHPVKDHMNFLKAASILRARYPDVRFILAGDKVNGQNVELCKEIQQLKISNQVHLLGEQKNMPRLTAALDIAVSSSYAEAFPNTIGEAMSCEVPCVVTDVGDSSEIVGDTGKVVKPHDPQALSHACIELISLKPDQRRDLGRRGRKRICDHYALNAVARRYQDLYVRILGKRNFKASCAA